MGVGIAYYVPPSAVEKTLVCAASMGYKAWDAGIIEHGVKRVILEPKDIVYNESSLQIR